MCQAGAGVTNHIKKHPDDGKSSKHLRGFALEKKKKDYSEHFRLVKSNYNKNKQ